MRVRPKSKNACLVSLVTFAMPALSWAGGADLSQIQCTCATVVASQIPGPLAGGGGQILANLSRSNSFTKAGYDLGKFHECQHNIGGADEQQADEKGAELACKAGKLTEEAVQNVCAILINSKSSTGKHPPGPQRCQTFKTALEKCKKGGGGSGGGGGNSCAGGQPFNPSQAPGGGQAPQPRQAGYPGFVPPGQGPSSITREDPDDSNPFKTGSYVEQAAKLDAKDGFTSTSSAPAEVPKGKSPQGLSQITSSAPAAALAPGHVDGPGGTGGSLAAVGKAGSNGSTSVNGVGSIQNLSFGASDSVPAPGVEEKQAGAPESSGAGGSSGGKSASGGGNTSAELLDSYGSPLSSPKAGFDKMETAGALKDFGAAPEQSQAESGLSLFERCHAAHRRAKLGGRLH